MALADGYGNGQAASSFEQAFRAIDDCLRKEAGCCSSGTAGPRQRSPPASSDVDLLASFVETIGFIPPDLVAVDEIKEDSSVALRLIFPVISSMRFPCLKRCDCLNKSGKASAACQRRSLRSSGTPKCYVSELGDSPMAKPSVFPGANRTPSAAACGMNIQRGTVLIVMRNGQICSLPPVESDNLPSVVEPYPAPPLVTPAGTF